MKNNVLIFISILIFFLLTRLFIIHGYERYWTDVGLYFDVAFVTVKGGYKAYHDVWWPYPPMTLIVINLPMYFLPAVTNLQGPQISEYINNNILLYRTLFQYEMLFFELITLSYLVLFLKNRCKIGDGKLVAAVFLYSLLGLLVGHLLFDRLDIVITAIFMVSVYHFTSERQRFKNSLLSYLVYLAGALFKLLPLLWWPVYFISECFSERSTNPKGKSWLNKWAISKKQLKRAFLPFLITVIPFVIIMFTFNQMTFNEEKQKGMFTFMSEHGQRGIQMESTWATPMMICNAYQKVNGKAVSFPLVTNFGAQHFKDSSVNSLYLFLSKYSGFLGLALIYIGFFVYFLLKQEKREDIKDPRWILNFLVFAVFFIISTQRVMSSQYMIWPMAGIVVLIFSSKKREAILLIMTCLIYMLSYIGFDLGYKQFIKFDPWIVTSVSLRNLLLAVLTIILFFRIIPRLREE